jgi:hypothetical protein
VIPADAPVELYWKMVDHFPRTPGSWRFLGTHWQVQSVLPTKKRLTLNAIITAGLSYRTGRFTMSSRVEVRGGRSVSFSRGALRELEHAGVTERLKQHGFQWREDEPLAFFPLNAWNSVFPRTFASERLYLSALTGKRAGVVGRAAPRSLRSLLDTFRGRRAGDWRPVNAQWELRKPIRLAGRPATAICMFHIAPADLEGRLGVASSITIWPPWNRKWPLPAWLSEYRARLDSQFRAAGHKAEWHKGPEGRGVMVTSMREDLRGLADVVRERRALEEADLGDPA